MERSTEKYLTRAALFILLAAQAACSKSDRWLGITYADKNNLIEHRVIGEFGSLQECLTAVNNAVGTQGAYECAKNCDASNSPMLCEETVGNEN